LVLFVESVWKEADSQKALSNLDAIACSLSPVRLNPLDPFEGDKEKFVAVFRKVKTWGAHLGCKWLPTAMELEVEEGVMEEVLEATHESEVEKGVDKCWKWAEEKSWEPQVFKSLLWLAKRTGFVGKGLLSSEKIVFRYLETGGNPTVKVAIEGRDLLSQAIVMEMNVAAEMLLWFGADVSFKDRWGNTPLHAAVWQESPELTLRLLELGADPAVANYVGKRPIDDMRLAIEGSDEHDAEWWQKVKEHPVIRQLEAIEALKAL